MDEEIKKLVCRNCWNNVFSVEAFHCLGGCRNIPESGVESSSTSPGVGYTYQTPSWAEMQRSIELMCEWCDILCDELLVYYQHVTKSKNPPANRTFRVSVRFVRHPERPLSLNISIENSWTPSWNVFTLSNDPAARYITERGLLNKLDAPETYALALQRIRECQSNHPRCPQPVRSTLPTRVIDCADPTRPRLFTTGGASDYYVALSYVWGEDQPHRTTSKNISSYSEHIDRKYIPKTIRDAIKVTHALGIRYLWVDAFCIIQDSDDDKATEIARIRLIFRHAYVTIIAANAKKVSDGFLNRSAIYNTPSTLPFRCPDGIIGIMKLQERAHAPREHVNTRAWCLEERVLSMRALWYCTHTLQYECQAAHINIDGSKNMTDPLDGVPRLPDCIVTPGLEPPIRDANTEQVVDKAWKKVLELYTRRALTKPQDRLLALSGVVDYFHGFWNTSRYIAGLWEHQLPGSLLWYTAQGKPGTRPKYRAPSWSWASVDGEISSLAVTYDGAVCSVKECYATPKKEVNPFGEVTAGVLVLDVILRRTTWDPVESELYETDEGLKGVQDDYRSERREIGYITVDVVEDVAASISEVMAAVLVERSTTLLGILLVPVAFDDVMARESAEEMRTYRRVGWFTAPFCDREAWLGSPRETVSIVSFGDDIIATGIEPCDL